MFAVYLCVILTACAAHRIGRFHCHKCTTSFVILDVQLQRAIQSWEKGFHGSTEHDLKAVYYTYLN